MNQRLTAIIEREGNGYVALCPDLDIASQGDSIDAARQNLREALELFFESASESEIAHVITVDNSPRGQTIKLFAHPTILV